jgi:bifunctional pyridoxal-dependent enzyme with beta-cystathionase and maltose regulon repressor activities
MEPLLTPCAADVGCRHRFPAAACITQALRRDRLEHGIFGYAAVRQTLRDRIVARLRTGYDWSIAPGEIVFLPASLPA